MATFDALADLPLEIEGYELQGLELQLPSFERLSTTVIHLWGGGEDGLGEDVTYDARRPHRPPGRRRRPRPDRPRDPRRVLRVHGRRRHLPGRARSATSRASTGAGRSSRRRSTWRCARRASGIAEALGREPRPVTFVCSMRLSPGEGQPSTIETLRRKLDPYPGLRFKLDPTNDWDRRADRRSWSRPARSTRSTSRASTKAPWSTSRPTRSSTRS